jgi:hypothetical protein
VRNFEKDMGAKARERKKFVERACQKRPIHASEPVARGFETPKCRFFSCLIR